MRILLLLIVIGAIPLAAEDWTIAGKTYHHVVVGNVYSDRVEITYDGGLGTPALKDLSPELQKRFGYDPAKAKTESDARAIAAAEAEKRVQAEGAARDKQMAVDKQEVSYARNRAPQHLCGKVQQNADGGCWVVCTFDPVASSDRASEREAAESSSNDQTHSEVTGETSQTAHYSRDSPFGNTGVALAPPPVEITAGTYYLTGATYTMNQALNLIVYETKPVRGPDGNLYRHFTTDKSELEP